MNNKNNFKLLFITSMLLGTPHLLFASKIFPKPTFQDSKTYKTVEQKAYRAYLILIRSANYQYADPQEQEEMINSLAHTLGLTIEHFRRIIDELQEKDIPSQSTTPRIQFQDYAPEQY